MKQDKEVSKIIIDEEQFQSILERDTEDIFVKESLLKKLRSGKQLRIKLGIDPTSPHIHIGRANVLRKLRAFQKLGHKAVFIVGDFTAQIGDPSDKLSKRPMLTEEDIQKNITTYKEQVGKIIDLEQAEFHYNSSWLSKLTFKEVAQLAETFTLQQMTARRNFSDRIEKGEEISLRELLYPLMQGYDSVVVKADVELGGFDQLFNVKAGRIIQKYFGQEEQDVLTIQMLEGTDGRKMSSSWGNIISITATPDDMYGKVMSVRDDLVVRFFKLATDVSLKVISQIEKAIADGENPKQYKMQLAREIVAIYHDTHKAQLAEEYWSKVFSEKKAPEKNEAIQIESEQNTLISDILVKNKIITSKSEWKRLIEGGAISHVENSEVISDVFVTLKNPLFLKVGKRVFVYISPKNG